MEHNRIIRLQGGGTLTLRLDASLFTLSKAERVLIGDLADRIQFFEQSEQLKTKASGETADLEAAALDELDAAGESVVGVKGW